MKTRIIFIVGMAAAFLAATAWATQPMGKQVAGAKNVTVTTFFTPAPKDGIPSVPIPVTIQIPGNDKLAREAMEHWSTIMPPGTDQTNRKLDNIMKRLSKIESSQDRKK